MVFNFSKYKASSIERICVFSQLVHNLTFNPACLLIYFFYGGKELHFTTNFLLRPFRSSATTQLLLSNLISNINVTSFTLKVFQSLSIGNHIVSILCQAVERKLTIIAITQKNNMKLSNNFRCIFSVLLLFSTVCLSWLAHIINWIPIDGLHFHGIHSHSRFIYLPRWFNLGHHEICYKKRCTI